MHSNSCENIFHIFQCPTVLYCKILSLVNNWKLNQQFSHATKKYIPEKNICWEIGSIARVLLLPNSLHVSQYYSDVGRESHPQLNEIYSLVERHKKYVVKKRNPHANAILKYLAREIHSINMPFLNSFSILNGFPQKVYC